MIKEKKIKIITMLEAVSKDMESDARNFDGKPLTGKTVAEYFGNHGAAISAVAICLRDVLLEDEKTL